MPPHPQFRPGQVRIGCAKAKSLSSPESYVSGLFQPMDPRFRMMLPQRGPLPPGQLPPRHPGPDPPPPASEASPLLAQQLTGSQQQQQQQTEQQHPQQQQQSSSHDQENSDELESDLNDLGVPDEDLLGMAEDFNILEFADALDHDESEGKGLLDDLAEEDSVGSASDVRDSKESESGSSAPASNKPGTSDGNQQPPPPPPPYTAAGSVSRGPPPPYPGSQQGPKPVSRNIHYACISLLVDDQPRLLDQPFALLCIAMNRYI
jgi:hypothetical protein